MRRMAMKMAAVSTISLLLLCCAAIHPTDSQDCDSFAATGGNITVLLNRKLGKSERLQWKRGNSVILDVRKGAVVFKQVDYYENGSLKLTNLKKSDAGTYTPEVFIEKASIKDLKTTRLCILDRVQKPEVKSTCPSSSTVKFTCNAAKGEEIEWLQNNKVIGKIKEPTLTQDVKKVETDSFSCKASNRVSSMTSDPVKQTCYTPKSFWDLTIFGISTKIIVGAGGGFVLVLILIVIICCIRTKRKKSIRMKDEGELRLAWTNEQQQQQHAHHHHHAHHQHAHPPDQHPHPHHHHPQQQQPAGHTGPRQHRSKQQRDQLRPRAPDTPSGQPQPSPRRTAQAPRPAEKAAVDDEQPPPLPQPRKKGGRAQRV